MCAMSVTPAVSSSWNAWLEIDTAAIRHNTAAVHEFVGPGVQVMAVVKADGYGHGAALCARAALAGGATWLGVSSAAEGAELRAAGIDAPTLVLGCGLPEQAAETVTHGLTQTLATEEMARALSQAALDAGRVVDVHIKVDTGMGRIGVRPQEALAFAQLVAMLPGLRIGGVYSHLATADEQDPTYAMAQAQLFSEVLSELSEQEIIAARRGSHPDSYDCQAPLRHLANSAATVRFPAMHFELVRTGLLIYGLSPLASDLVQPRLVPALSWKSRIACVKSVPAGEHLSYGGLYTTPRPTRIACVSVGYADGFPRALSNLGVVLVRGQRCRVVGAVCMDQMLVDVGDIAACAGDEVVLIGEQMNERAGRPSRITANEVAAAQGTVVHEIVARLGKRLPRVEIETSAPKGGQ